ncbi:MAG: hypothetical protein ACFFAS_10535 [Promethearchaeota archaeon]
MKKIFFIKSETINLKNYTIKDPLGSSGRLDVISRCILAALIKNGSFEENTQIWTFLNNYGTYIFDTNKLDYQTFPKNELRLTQQFAELIQGVMPDSSVLNSVIKTKMDIIDAIEYLLGKKHDFYILEENGKDFSKHIHKNALNNVAFIIGNQVGDFITSEDLRRFKFPSLSFGAKSYLASSIIRLIHFHLD